MLLELSWSRICRIVLALALAVFVSEATLPQESAADERDDRFEHAVKMAGTQRMLSQKIGKEAILVALGINREENLKRLRESHAMFQRITKGLRVGDPKLGLQPTSEEDLLRHLDRVEQLWNSVDRLLANGLIKGEVANDDVIAVAEMTEPLYTVVDEMVKAFRQEAQKGKLVFSVNILAIDYATRQGMLSQKLAKELLLVAFGHSAEKNRKALGRSKDNFDRVLNALLEGDLQLRLRKAPTAEIRVELQKALRVWNEMLPATESVASGQPVNDEVLAMIGNENLQLLQTIEAATSMYESL